MKGTFKFPRTEHLKSTKAIGELFARGIPVSLSPLFSKYEVRPSIEVDQEPGLKAAFSVSKRNFKRAVDRNRIKRLMREAFRLHVIRLRQGLQQEHLQLQIIIVFTGKSIPTYVEVEAKTKILIKKLEKKLKLNVVN